MQIRLILTSSLLRRTVLRRRFFASFLLVAALLIAAQALFATQPDSITAAGLLFLPLVLFAALSAGREFLTPSLKELAFYLFAMVAAGLIWPGANLAVAAYEASGFVAIAAFMAFVFALAVALGVLSADLLASHDGET
ncbi:hypothetical protein [Taklimakanibacter lacteus]|uniref:hypothetical protein n=1 Tax=Taklimakanibacter lacteus TaxID=2268456 RepID=UPI0013C45EBA